MSARLYPRRQRTCLTGLIVASALVFSMPVWAASYAVVSASVDLRAGPRVGYPVLYVLRPGVRVLIHGCLDDYSWCDVSALDYRGWVYADYLDYEYDNRRVTIAGYGPQIGIAIVVFSLGDYWSHHYRQRPWYRERHSYEIRYGPHGDRGRPVHPGSGAPDRRPPARIEHRSPSRPASPQHERNPQYRPDRQPRPTHSPSSPHAHPPRHTRPPQGPSQAPRQHNSPSGHGPGARQSRPGQHGNND
ncbi:SH3 domain-containing protein [Salinisphaera hydrothermalis]|uniref:SH3 domain-containing protein n=1 Tax=Salinisphaera hydrothermalis TaxID=563188 RepID=UPI0033422423